MADYVFPRFSTYMLKVLEVAGAASGTAITVTGLEVEDKLIQVLAFATRTNELATQGDITADVTVAAGTITCATEVTSNMLLTVLWLAVDEPEN